jgi:transcriptional regulator with XRE-family HTH domain
MDKHVKEVFIQMDKNIGERIKEIRQKSGLTQGQFAARLKISLPTANRWERGHRTPDAHQIVKIGEAFDCDLLWLLTGRANPEAATEGGKIPLLASIPEDLSNIPEERIVSSILIPGLPEDAWAIQVKGDDLLPTICTGDYVVVGEGEVAEGEVVLYRSEWGDARVRRFSLRGGGLLIAEHPDYPPIRSGGVKLIGRVVQVIRHLTV